MSLFRWLKPNRRTPGDSPRPAPRRPGYRPHLEPLEDRLAPATVRVTTVAEELTPNNGVVSLREAITAINAGNTLGDPDIAAQNPGTFGNSDAITFAIPGPG